jgi:hypothetical protein
VGIRVTENDAQLRVLAFGRCARLTARSATPRLASLLLASASEYARSARVQTGQPVVADRFGTTPGGE